MFGLQKLLVKALLRENARLRRQLEQRDRVVMELIDRFIHNRVPERFVRQGGDTTAAPSVYVPSGPSDAYSMAIDEAERMILEKTRNQDFVSLTADDDV